MNVKELLKKEKITLEEFEFLEEQEEITNVEDCGMSGKYYGYHWYSVTYNNEEYSIYIG